MTSEEAQKLKSEALDLLNQVAILLKDVNIEDESDWDSKTQQHIKNPEWYPENRILCVIKEICEDLSYSQEYSDVMEYYSSHCFGY